MPSQHPLFSENLIQHYNIYLNETKQNQAKICCLILMFQQLTSRMSFVVVVSIHQKCKTGREHKARADLCRCAGPCWAHSQQDIRTQSCPGCWNRWTRTPWDVADTHPHLEIMVNHTTERSQSNYHTHTHTATLVNSHTLGSCQHCSTSGKHGQSHHWMIPYLENTQSSYHTPTQLPWWTHTPREVADTHPHLNWVNYTTDNHSQVITHTENCPGCWRRWICTPWDVADTHPHLENVVDHNTEWSQPSNHLHTATLVNLHTLGRCWHSSTPGKQTWLR